MKYAKYKCQICDSTVKIPLDAGFEPPKRCENCKKFAMVQVR